MQQLSLKKISDCTACSIFWSMPLKKSVSVLDEAPALTAALSGSGCSSKVTLVSVDELRRGLSSLWVSVSIPWFFTGILTDFKAYKSCSLMKLLTFLISAT